MGLGALYENTEGNNNTAAGTNALEADTTGGNNTAAGLSALVNLTTGNNNTAIGYEAGQNPTTGNNNIDIGNAGLANDANTIWIGTEGTQKRVIIAGINRSGISGTDVVVNSAGRLGIIMSSARYKKDIRNMGALSDGLLKLRPVTFRYKQDRSNQRQYGLIAEEVARGSIPN
jgi:hypothetical protein